ncbi:MAG: Hg(II)-responsive transcriptional regulator [Rubrivivax sp.]|nr:Hg(II)-responsive transcriptional regulator [Rubrivivax sp.]
MSGLTIGALAVEAAVHVETIRYYHRRGLLPQPDKPAHGHRRYAGDALRRVRFIRRAQTLGFTLEEIGNLLQLDETHACAETRDLATHKLRLIEDKLTDLRAIRRALTDLVHRCGTGGDGSPCPIIDALSMD